MMQWKREICVFDNCSVQVGTTHLETAKQIKLLGKSCCSYLSSKSLVPLGRCSSNVADVEMRIVQVDTAPLETRIMDQRSN